ncbi:MAG: OmpH family outer membrane protein [Bacteroidetes bacterium]|nr:MAG: OmpH family outer membrane protein [Bacteroidota bacterium]
MKTIKFIFLSFALVFFTLSVQAQRGARMGYVDMEYILESVPEYQEASTQLAGKVQRWKKDLDKMNDEIEQMKLNLSNERVLLTKELIEEREEEIKILEDEMLKYQHDRFGPNGDLDIQRRQLVQPIQDQVFNIVQEIAEAKKYDFIFDKSADVVMLFASKRNDISEQVLRSINRAARREEAKSRKDKKEIEKREELSLEEENEVTEREIAAEERKNERERLLEERKRVRDSVRAANKIEFEEKRRLLIEERQRRKDSLSKIRNGEDPPVEGDGEGNGGDGNGGGLK